MMQGRGSDTRMYAPRSESSHMYRNNHEEDEYGLEDGTVRDAKHEKKQKEREEEKRKISSIKHIKIKPSDLKGLEDEDEREDDSEKYDDDRELDAMTGPPGNGGFETSMAQGAKGPGAAAGELFAMGEPMSDAWSSLMKESFEYKNTTYDGHEKVENAVKDKEAKLRGNRNHSIRGSVGVRDSLTSNQRRGMDGLKSLLRRFGSFDNMPEQLRRKLLPNFLLLQQTEKMKRNDANYDKERPGNRKFVHSSSDKGVTRV